MRLSGKTAIVTGGARGIGYAIAKRFLREGAQVVIADTDDEAGDEAVADLKDLGDVEFVNCDVGERLDVHNLVAATINAFGDIDILVNNAGIIKGGDFLTFKEADFDTVLRVNLKGTFLCSQAVAKHMVKRIEADGPVGTIINMSSVLAKIAIPDQLAYTVAKGGVEQLTIAMAQTLAPHGIRVNAIGPGSIATDMFDALAGGEAARRRVIARTPMGRVGEPQEIAAIATFLACADASYITGQTIYADGGRLGQAFALEDNASEEG
ncbi:MAG: 3-oxoacyl-ACP reductase family protein [Pseudomonadota bacterium]